MSREVTPPPPVFGFHVAPILLELFSSSVVCPGGMGDDVRVFYHYFMDSFGFDPWGCGGWGCGVRGDVAGVWGIGVSWGLGALGSDVDYWPRYLNLRVFQSDVTSLARYRAAVHEGVVVGLFAFFCGIMDLGCPSIRGYAHSMPMIFLGEDRALCLGRFGGAGCSVWGSRAWVVFRTLAARWSRGGEARGRQEAGTGDRGVGSELDGEYVGGDWRDGSVLEGVGYECSIWTLIGRVESATVVGMICADLVRQSIMTQIVSSPFDVLVVLVNENFHRYSVHFQHRYLVSEPDGSEFYNRNLQAILANGVVSCSTLSDQGCAEDFYVQ
ncbi:hypothetical protein Tco_0134951 [Tanacetum coccineum]